MSEVQSGLEGVVAFETEIAEPDREGGALRYRGVDIEDLVGVVPYENVWGLLVDGSFEPGLLPAEPHPLMVRSGDPRVDVQSALAMLAPEWGFGQLLDITDEEARNDLARSSVMALSFVAQSARGLGQPWVPQSVIDEGSTIAERFLLRWRGELDPNHAKAIDAYWVSAAEHGMNASTFTARVVASTGADVAAALSSAVGALSGPLHGGAPSRVLTMLDEVEAQGDAQAWVVNALDSGERLMGFGHRVYRAEDPRARVLRRTAKELGSPRFEVAEALEEAALQELAARKPDRVLATNVEFWSAVVLDMANIPSDMFTSMFTCARVAGWSAHIMEQKRESRLIRPSASYVGPAARPISEVDGVPS
ncbi:MAG: citrate synthase 2 [Solirubrobacteraceae bacterium]|nr:citrate synthase 2 [Solirubrobacteraceae bacterium]